MLKRNIKWPWWILPDRKIQDFLEVNINCCVTWVSLRYFILCLFMLYFLVGASLPLFKICHVKNIEYYSTIVLYKSITIAKFAVVWILPCPYVFRVRNPNQILILLPTHRDGILKTNGKDKSIILFSRIFVYKSKSITFSGNL